MTTPERLALLVPFANGDALTDVQVGRCLFRFLHDFQGAGLRLPNDQRELWDLDGASAAELQAVARKVKILFTVGFWFEGRRPRGTESITADDIRLPLSFPSLRFGAFSPPRGRRDRFALLVEAGRLRDLVPFLAMHLLTSEAVTIRRCTAPAYRDWRKECGRLFIGAGRGRPRIVCSRTCATRVKNARINDVYRAARRSVGRQPRRG